MPQFVLLVACLTSLVAAHAAVQPSAQGLSSETVQRILEAGAMGQYAEAVDLLEARLRTVPVGGMDEAKLSSYIGDAYLNLGRYLEAETAYRRSIQICRRAGPNAQAQLATDLNNLGSLYLEIGRPSQSRQALQEAFLAAEQLGDEGPDLLVVTLNNLASVAQKLV